MEGRQVAERVAHAVAVHAHDPRAGPVVVVAQQPGAGQPVGGVGPPALGPGRPCRRLPPALPHQPLVALAVGPPAAALRLDQRWRRRVGGDGIVQPAAHPVLDLGLGHLGADPLVVGPTGQAVGAHEGHQDGLVHGHLGHQRRGERGRRQTGDRCATAPAQDGAAHEGAGLGDGQQHPDRGDAGQGALDAAVAVDHAVDHPSHPADQGVDRRGHGPPAGAAHPGQPLGHRRCHGCLLRRPNGTPARPPCPDAPSDLCRPTRGPAPGGGCRRGA